MAQRMVGVSVPAGQNQMANEQTRGQPRQLQAIHEMKTYGIQYTDDSGTVHTGLCHKLGDVVYIHPHDEQWSASIRTASKWLGDAINEKIAMHEALKEPEPEGKPMVDVTPPKENEG